MSDGGEDVPFTAETVLDHARAELELLHDAFDAVDAKCGVLLGFAGAVAALTPNTETWLRVPGIVLAALAAGIAAYGAWPRKLKVPSAAETRRRCLERPLTEHSTIRLADQFIVHGQEVSEAARGKALAAQWATAALLAAVVFDAVGLLVGKP